MGAVKTVTLTEFLLARFTEDERSVRDNWNGTTGITDERWWGTPFQPSRILHDFEAKRRIVYLHEGGTHECSTYDHTGERDSCTWVLHEDECSTLCLLALTYAGHPDYREAWKP